MARPPRVYDRLITIQRQGPDTDDGYTTVPGAWEPYAENIPARRVIRGGDERFANAQNAATQITVFYTRWSPELAQVSPQDRIVHEGRNYELSRPVQELGRRDEIEWTTIAAVS